MIVETVRAAHRALVAARLAEAVLVGVAGACLALAASLLSGAELGAPDAWWTSALVAGLSGAAFAGARPLDREGTARLLDERFGLDGGVGTALEWERAGRPGRVGALLSAQLRSRLSPARAARGVVGLSLLPIVAPFAGAVVLAVARDGVERARGGPDVADLAAQLSDALAGAGALAGAAGAPGERGEGAVRPEVARRLLALSRAAARLESAGSRAEVGALRAELDALDRELAADELRARLAEPRALLDAVRLRGGDLGSDGGAGAGLRPGTAPSEVDGSAAAVGAVHAAPPGASPGRWWSADQDGLVGRWVEARRRRTRTP